MTSINQKAAAALFVAILVIAALLIFQRPSHRISRENRTKADPRETAIPTSAGAISNRPALGTPPSETAEATTAKSLHQALAALKSTANADEARKILADLRTYLESLPSDLAAAVISRFLADSVNNATTRIEFSISQTGSLDGHPSLRVALLDWLGHIDPRQAGVMAAQILATPTDADEWAVSLRNYARAHPDTDSVVFLRAKTEELIHNPAWRVNPSIGFFEAFDVLAHTRATESTGLLSELVADRSPAGKPLAHAAFLTLDRLTLREPAAMMEQLAAHPELTKSRGEMVANLVARADLRDPTQQQLVRGYLLDPSRTASELAAFAGIYPNANFTISNNLLSENLTLSRDEITSRDAAAIGIIINWLADPAFVPVKSHLTAIHQRLETFVGQANKGVRC